MKNCFKIFMTLLSFSSVTFLYALDFPEAKVGCREEIIKRGSNSKALFQNNENPEDLVDNPSQLIKNLDTMTKRNLTTGQVKNKPWSDSYWPIASGASAYRYNDPKNQGETWEEMFKYFLNNPTESYLTNEKIALLSPAEKYDLLLADSNYMLTNQMWAEGKRYFDRYGKVEPWMGLCHGWAAVSFMWPEPTKKVLTKSTLTKLPVPFMPSDIKSLGTLVWAKGRYPSKYLGGRCNVKNPKRDSNGRITDPECFDVNPGSWHIAVVNQVGVNKRSMVIDATFDYEVWNQPLLSYKYTYFNPNTKTVGTLDKSAITVSEFKKDKFKQYRSSKVKKVVGIFMDLVYVAEVEPDHKVGATNPLTATVRYQYDLELDENLNVIGGEWYSEAHPDFMWVPELNSVIDTSGDKLIKNDTWKTTELVPTLYKTANQMNAQQGIPLRKVVQKLFKASWK